ncbi:MAG TPA: hypothetical protein VFL82_15455 [Thermomicrobiales bacterium]|nr:hypothetical protein [Thermomicrobiales bacterium]
MNRIALRPDARQTDKDQFDMLVASACLVAEQSDDVRSIFVITNERPSYQALMRYRAQADACGLTVTMLGSGGVVVRRQDQSSTTLNAPAATSVRRNAE